MSELIREASSEDYADVIRVWEASVRATHHFLDPEDITFYKSIIPEALPQVKLFIYESEGHTAGFMGISGNTLDMLFIDPDYRRKGIGSKLFQYAQSTFGISKVDVNEQNLQAVDFYLKTGFVQTGRRATDDFGKAYPILEMTLGTEE
ncbi:GNAT family N-acetyltransferase [Elizabethkingia sp. HvH-WGS333]|jgi:putative acetyltransferase|uniref:GNAT family N-acetyltransferase n=1 Tax=Elizabethkingia TaxID=308865 RepID=UPI0007415C2F|nr:MULTISPECIES: GNAT family N-acetyltransferase [Elizabethkingia]KUG12566.1 GCN5 family acetyltransferase [Elizabethkingia miricola]MCL1657204.1 GNAT family N-acetyltransferase [Elizabethkingia miricola]MDX8569868.1 GNAT family N-acetyltransferase [Elizabethkingia sp. HX XZB]MDX8572114.1 GNAT family N-acetyltransferase [Elizabethkingia sp. HX QKY]NHQ66816.1 GNAT family N-acetyltransferase [Elizabethkingia miricola]